MKWLFEVPHKSSGKEHDDHECYGAATLEEWSMGALHSL